MLGMNRNYIPEQQLLNIGGSHKLLPTVKTGDHRLLFLWKKAK
jgi:hypothetical protein